jgi:hypothetical protein
MEATLTAGGARRPQLSRCHNLAYPMMAGPRNTVAGHESKGADIDDGGKEAMLRIRGEVGLDAKLPAELDIGVRFPISQSIPIMIEKARSPDVAGRILSVEAGRPGLGPVRHLQGAHILGVDASPCSGNHMGMTAKISAYALGAPVRGSFRGEVLLGFLTTALAGMLGAPFWFDVLNKVMVIRSTVKPHEKSPEEASEDRQIGSAQGDNHANSVANPNLDLVPANVIHFGTASAPVPDRTASQPYVYG